MTDTTEEPREPRLTWWEVIKASYGGFSAIGILTGTISIIRLLTAHTTLTLNGVVKDIVAWYHKFFHEGIDTALTYLANKIHVQPIHVSNEGKDLILIVFLVMTFLFRSAKITIRLKHAYIYTRRQRPALFVSFGFAIFSIILSIVFTIFKNHLPKFNREIFSDSVVCAYIAMVCVVMWSLSPSTRRIFFVQIASVLLAVASLLILSAYS